MKYLISIITVLLCPLTAYASAELPSAPFERIRFIIDRCDSMPKTMVTGIVILVILIILTILVKGRKNNE